MMSEDEKRHRTSRLVLLLGIAFNIAFLGYFKYIDFGRSTINDIFGAKFCLHARNSPSGNLLHYVSKYRLSRSTSMLSV